MNYSKEIYEIHDLVYLHRIINIIEECSIEELRSERCIRTIAVYFEAMRIEKNFITDKYMNDDSDKDKSTFSIWNVLDYYGHYYREIECFGSEFKQLLNKKIAKLLKTKLLIKFRIIMKLETKNYYPMLRCPSQYLSTIHITSDEIKNLRKTYFKKKNIIFKNLKQFCNFEAKNYKDLITNPDFEKDFKTKLYSLLGFDDNQFEGDSRIPPDHIEKLKELKQDSENENKKYDLKKNHINKIKNNSLFFQVKRIIQVAIEYKNLCSYQKMSEKLANMNNQNSYEYFEIWCIKSREMLKIFTPSSILEKPESDFISDVISDLSHLRNILEHPYKYYQYKDIPDWKREVIDKLKDRKLRLDRMVNDRLESLEKILPLKLKKKFLWRILTFHKDIQNESFNNLKEKEIGELLKKYDLKSIDETSFEIFKQLNNRFNYIYDKLNNENSKDLENLRQKTAKQSPVKIFGSDKRNQLIADYKVLETGSTPLENLKERWEEKGLKDLCENLKSNQIKSKDDIKELFPKIKREELKIILSRLKEICFNLKQEVSKFTREELKKKLEDESQLKFQLYIDLKIVNAFFIMDNYSEKFEAKYKNNNDFLILKRIYYHIKPCRNFIVHEPWKTRYNKEDVVYILSGLCLEVVQKLLRESSPVDQKMSKLDGLYHYDDKHKQILHNLAEPESIVSLAQKLYQKGAIVTMSSEDGTVLNLALKNSNIKYAQFIQKLGSTGLERSKRLQNFRFLLQYDSVETIKKFIENNEKKIFDPVDYPIAISVLKKINGHRERSIEERIEIIEEFLKMEASKETLCQINSKEIITGNSVGHYLVTYEYDDKIGDFIQNNNIDMSQKNKKRKSPIYELIDHHTGKNLQMWLEYFLRDTSIDESERKRLLEDLTNEDDADATIFMTLSPPAVKYIGLKNNYLIETKKDDIVYEIRLNSQTDENVITKCCFEKLLNLGEKKLNCKEAKIILVFQFSENSSKEIPLTFSIENLSNPKECCMTLGKQFLEENEVIIDFKKKCLRMQKLEIELGPDNSISKSPNRILKALLAKS